MKYTVVLAQSVPPEIRPELAERLNTRFGLPLEQAQKLAARKAGRLLKPTTRTRAETLLSVYQAMNLGATLEEVPDDEAPSSGATSEAAPAAAPSAPATAVVAPVASAAPAVPLAKAPEAAPVVVAPTPAPAPTPVIPAPAPVSSGAPAFSASSLAAPAATADAPVRDVQASPVPTVERTFEDEMPREEEVPAQRRSSLRQRVLLTTVLPLIATGVLSAIGASIATNQILTRITRQGAEALAASVGSTVNIDDVNQLDTQLRTLLQQPTVGFIAVNTPDGLQFFRSKNEEADFLLGDQVNEWIGKNPSASSYVSRDQPAARYKLQLQQLRESGAVLADAEKVLEQKINAPESQQTTVTNYEIQNIGVYDEGGRRVAGPAKATGENQPLFTVAVGVVTNEATNLARTSLVILLLLALLFTGIAAFFAVRTARRIVQPIENLVAAADKISLGQLDTPVVAERNDEIGDLARALERMRLSLEAAMERLRRRRNRA